MLIKLLRVTIYEDKWDGRAEDITKGSSAILFRPSSCKLLAFLVYDEAADTR